MQSKTHSELSKSATVFRYWGAPPADIQDKCIFCRIASGATRPGLGESGQLLEASSRAVCFEDIAPVAAAHVLVIPRAHIKNWRYFERGKEHAALVKEMLDMGKRALAKLGHGEAVERGDIRAGFIRPPFNSVHHVHMHVMTSAFEPSVGWMHRLGFGSSLFFADANAVIAELEPEPVPPNSRI